MAAEHVLVVDDDPGLLTLMQTRLEATGYGVTLVEKGEEALAWAQEHAYDLAIVDLKMADFDGLSYVLASCNPAHADPLRGTIDILSRASQDAPLRDDWFDVALSITSPG